MKRLLILLSFCVPVVFFSGENNSVSGADTPVALELLRKYHFSGLVFDSDKISEIKRDFITNLDDHGFFFLKSDVDELLSVSLSENDLPYTNSRNAFFQKSIRTYKTRLTETLRLINELCAKSPDYTVDESVSKYDGPPVYPADERRKRLRWSSLIKFDTLSGVYEKYSEDKEKKPFKEYLQQYEASARSDAGKRSRQRISSILDNTEGFENYISQIYVNALVMRFDPHSMVLSAKFMKRFVSDLSSQTQSFGFAFNRDRSGDIVVERIIPGGPAWKSGVLSNGDKIQAVSSSGSAMIDLSGRSFNEVYDLINGKSNKITVKIKKKNGRIVTGKLVKQKMSGDNKIMTSYLLDGKKKIGYIGLPAFYTDWDTPGQLGCANDVAREIIKLQRDKIDGLILDLRDNSGGSVSEALNLAGLFIDEGPMMITVNKQGETAVIKDPSRGTVYDGPLTVLINSQSASASELTAAILKDYNRALIAGSRSFGKASMQEVVPVKRSVLTNPGQVSLKQVDSDFLKLTVSILYSASGESFQKSGVVPHVEIPEISDPDSEREDNQKYSIIPPKINKTAKIEKLDDFNAASLAKKSRSRISDSARFEAIRKINDDRKSEAAQSCSLNADKFAADFKRIIFTEGDLYKSVFAKADDYSAKLNSQDTELSQIDSYLKDVSADKISSLNEDAVVDETYRITLDYINLIK